MLMDKVCPRVNLRVFRRRVCIELPTLTLFFSFRGVINSHLSQIISSTLREKEQKKKRGSSVVDVLRVPLWFALFSWLLWFNVGGVNVT